MRLPKHLFFNPPHAPKDSFSPHPATRPPSSQHPPRLSTPPPPTYLEATSPLSRRRSHVSQDGDGGPFDMGVSVTTLPSGREGAGPETTTLLIDDPTVMVMFLGDYRRTKEYMRELEWKVALRKALRRNLYKWYALLVIVITISALLSVKHEDVVHFCAPVTKRIREWPGGWLIPIALLIIVSFPPLVGHEIIGILCGLVWGLGIGFAILAAGTFLGEIATWIAFKWMCTARAARFEKKNKLYASLTQLIREKSFMFVLVLRFSAVPGHITTAVSASAGANFWSYLAAAFLTLPKQLTIAYLGTAFGTKSRKNTIISVCTTILTLIGTVIAAVYIYYQMRLLMRRQPTTIPALPTTMQEAAALSLDLSSSTLGRRATVAAIKSAPGTHNDLWSDLHTRRPWLVPGRGDEQTLSRARSLPGPMNQVEMRTWELDNDSNTPRKVDDGFGSRPPSRVLVWNNTPLSMGTTSRWAMPATGDVDLAAVLPDQPRMDGEDGVDGIYPLGPSRGDRGTMSLDIPRPPALRLGGREIADDADLFAVTRGARRPEYGRSRGESRAALLGRPDWDDRSESGDSHRERVVAFKAERDERALREEERDKMGNNGLLTVEGAQSAQIGKGRLASRKEREYGRPRGESGAALLGRPHLQ